MAVPEETMSVTLYLLSKVEKQEVVSFYYGLMAH